MPGAPNPEAITWYVQRSEDLLDDLRERVQSLRTRGGQLAGYTVERFSHEPDLWRVHLRTIPSLLDAIESITIQGDDAARAVSNAEYSFLVGLFSVGVALVILIVG